MDLWLEADSPLAPLGLWREAGICKDLKLKADSAISVYNTFVHIATPPIGLRRIQSAPGDLSLLRPTEAEDDQSVFEPETAVAAEDPQNYTAVTERKFANLSGKKGRRGKRPRRAVRKMNKAAANREAAASLAAAATAYVHLCILRGIRLSKQLLEDRSRGQALKRLRCTCRHVDMSSKFYFVKRAYFGLTEAMSSKFLPDVPPLGILWSPRRSCAVSAATGGSATYHASIVHPPAQQWSSERTKWRFDKSVMARLRAVEQELKRLYSVDGHEMLPCDDESDVACDWNECRHCGEQLSSAWKTCNMCGSANRDCCL